jgi:hypothetical protein
MTNKQTSFVSINNNTTKLFRSVSIFCVIKPLYCMSKALGLVPIIIVSNESGYIFAKMSVRQLLYGVVFLLAVHIPYILTYRVMFITADLVSILTSLIQCVSNVACNSVAYFCCLAQWQRVFTQIIKLNTWDSISSFPSSIYCTVKRKLIVYIIICFITKACLAVLTVRALGFGTATILNSISCSVSFLYTLMVELQFITIVIVLRLHYAFINRFLERECDVLNTESQEMYKTTVTVGQIGGVSYIMNSSASFRRHSVIHGPMCKSLTKLHNILCDVVQEINSAYSPCLVVNAARTFTTITFCLYYLIITYRREGSDTDSHVNLTLMDWIIILTANITFIVHTCNSSAHEVSFHVY